MIGVCYSTAMQTFLPYRDFEKTAASLDMKRLGKQRVETLQIVKAILTPTQKGWQNHPAVNMWRGYLGSLLDYQVAICYEWVANRGYKDTCLEKTELLLESADLGISDPPWLGNEAVHVSHQSNLVQKDPIFYRTVFPDAPDNLEYVWPVS